MLLLAQPVLAKQTFRALTELIQGSEQLCRIDMNTLAQEHYAASLTRNPRYVGVKRANLFDADKIAGSYSVQASSI